MEMQLQAVKEGFRNCEFEVCPIGTELDKDANNEIKLYVAFDGSGFDNQVYKYDRF